MLKRSVAHILLTCFLLWLIPLGQFITRGYEAQACGGQRAFCMCIAPIVKQVASGQFKLIAALNPVSQEQAPVTPGAGHDFMLPKASFIMTQNQMLPFVDPIHLPAFLYIRFIEHVPKI